MKSHSNMVQRAAMGWRMSARSGPRFKEALGGPAWDYRNIIEKLQVQNQQMPSAVLMVAHLSNMCQMWKKPDIHCIFSAGLQQPCTSKFGERKAQLFFGVCSQRSQCGGPFDPWPKFGSYRSQERKAGSMFFSPKWSTEKDLLSPLSWSHILLWLQRRYWGF